MHLAPSEARRGFGRPLQRAMPGPVLDPPGPHPAHQKRRRQRRNSVRERTCVACAPTGRTVDSCYIGSSRLQVLPDQKSTLPPRSSLLGSARTTLIASLFCCRLLGCHVQYFCERGSPALVNVTRLPPRVIERKGRKKKRKEGKKKTGGLG
jgi:hypothetical protein